MNTSNFTKGQKQALLESLTAQYEAGNPMTNAERTLLADLTKETLRKNVMTKLNTLAYKVINNSRRKEEIENQELIFKADRKELETIERNEANLDKELMKYISERNVTKDEFAFSGFRDLYEGDGMEMMEEFLKENNNIIL